MSQDNSQSKCGPHVQICSNPNLRISQCPCGTYHVSFQKRGITLQVGLEEVRALAEGAGVALKVVEAEERGRALGPGSCIN